MVLPLDALDQSMRHRVKRFLLSLAAIWYARRTWRAFHDHHFHLQLQAEFQQSNGSKWQLLKGIFRYTFASQLIAALEYLIPLVKPVLALRIARLLVWKGENVVSNVLYGDHPRNTIDIYGVEKSQVVAPEKKPVLLFVHGGAWSFGHKWQYGLVGKYLAKHGFLVGVINYRTYPTGSVQDQVKDVQDAIHWIAEHADQYGGDRQRIFLIGHSSGAHIGALMLAQSARKAISPSSEEGQDVGHAHRHIQGFIGLAGPYDITEHYDYEANRKVGPIDGVHEISTMKPAMLGESKFDESSPTKLFQDLHAQHIELPRFHILHGNADDVVPASSSKKMTQSLVRAAHDAEYIELDGGTHEDILFAVMGDNVPIKHELISHLKRITQISKPNASQGDHQSVTAQGNSKL